MHYFLCSILVCTQNSQQVIIVRLELVLLHKVQHLMQVMLWEQNTNGIPADLVSISGTTAQGSGGGPHL